MFGSRLGNEKLTYRDEFAPVATPASPSFKIATICDSVNLDFLMTSPVPRESTVCLESEPGGAYDFDTATPLPRDQSSRPEVMSRRTKTSSRAIPGEAASLSERRAMKSAFSPRRRRSEE